MKLFSNKNTSCPFCKETIKVDALKCKHCGEWLNEEKNTEDKINNAKKIDISNEVRIFNQDNPKINNRFINKEEIYEPSKSTNIFKKAFSFEGRITRKEYNSSLFISYIAWQVWVIFIVLIGEKLPSIMDIGITILLYLGVVFLIWFVIAQGVKRCHDLGNNGFYMLIPYYAVVIIFVNGENVRNKYGENPKINKTNAVQDAN